MVSGDLYENKNRDIVLNFVRYKTRLPENLRFWKICFECSFIHNTLTFTKYLPIFSGLGIFLSQLFNLKFLYSFY